MTRGVSSAYDALMTMWVEFMIPGDTAERRLSERSSVFLSATIDAANDPAKVVVRNLSARGALIEGTRLPKEGERLLFGANGISADSEVVWTRNGRSGVRFDSDVNPREAFRPIPAPRYRSVQRSSRPGLRSTLSRGEEALIKSWGIPAAAVLGD